MSSVCRDEDLCKFPKEVQLKHQLCIERQWRARVQDELKAEKKRVYELTQENKELMNKLELTDDINNSYMNQIKRGEERDKRNMCKIKNLDDEIRILRDNCHQKDCMIKGLGDNSNSFSSSVRMRMEEIEHLKKELHEKERMICTLNEDIEHLNKKHANEIDSMRSLTNHNAIIAAKRYARCDDKKELENKYQDTTNTSSQETLVKNLKEELNKAFERERKDLNEIDDLREQVKDLKSTIEDHKMMILEVKSTRDILHKTVNELRIVISNQNDYLKLINENFDEWQCSSDSKGDSI